MYSCGVTNDAPAPVLQLLADEHRWQLLRALAAGDSRVGELTASLDTSQNLVSYHLGELRKAGLVSSRRSAADGRDVYYRAELTRLRDLLATAGGPLHPGLLLGPVSPLPAPARGRQPRVLFLCTGNSARSQMAEALLVARTDGAVHVRSAGSAPKPLHPLAVRAMAVLDIDISACASKPLRQFARSRFDHVVTLCDKVREVCPDFPGPATPRHWSMADPSADGTYDAFVRARDEIDERVAFLIHELTHKEAA